MSLHAAKCDVQHSNIIVTKDHSIIQSTQYYETSQHHSPNGGVLWTNKSGHVSNHGASADGITLRAAAQTRG